MSTIFSIFIYNFKSIFRNFNSTGIMFILPIVFMGIFGLLLGSQVNKLDFSLGVYTNPDIPKDMIENLNLVTNIEEISKESEDLEFQVKNFGSLQELEDKIKDGEITVGIKLTEKMNQPQFEVMFNDNNLENSIKANTIKEILTNIYFQNSSPITSTVIKTSQQVKNPFDILAPGLIVYGILILMPGIAQKWTEISEKNQIFRYNNSRVSSFELVLGNFLFYLIIGLIQVVILYITAQVFGYNPTGNLLLAFIPASLTLFFVIGIGILIGTFYNKMESSNNTANILSIILGFLSGSFIVGIDSALEFKLFGKTLAFNDFIPTKWSTKAMESILTRNNGLMDIQFEIIVLRLSGILALGLSTWFYTYKRKSIE